MTSKSKVSSKKLVSFLIKMSKKYDEKMRNDPEWKKSIVANIIPTDGWIINVARTGYPNSENKIVKAMFPKVIWPSHPRNPILDCIKGGYF